MSLRDRNIRKDTISGRMVIPFALDDVLGSLTDAPRGSFMPGLPFRIVDVQHFFRDITANFSYQVKLNGTGVGALRAAASVADGGNTGNGTMGSLSADNNAKVGAWIVKCIVTATNGGTFSIADPDLVVVGTVAVGTPYNGAINFTIADGAIDFALDDFFTVTVTRGKTVPADATRANLVLDSNANLLYGDANDEVTVEVTTDTNGRAEEGVVLVTIAGRDSR